jgi:hypothetical protein
VALAHDDHTVRIFHSDTGKLKEAMVAHTEGVADLDYDPTNRYLITCCTFLTTGGIAVAAGSRRVASRIALHSSWS